MTTVVYDIMLTGIQLAAWFRIVDTCSGVVCLWPVIVMLLLLLLLLLLYRDLCESTASRCCALCPACSCYC